ncbi:type VII secretion target [Plantactinospora sp. CA-290183]|uniref:type VII secretion target n=1 Tax=Plantactinospora sp. CA-290183 TaxID=3240006 RepID=UPI003D8C0286
MSNGYDVEVGQIRSHAGNLEDLAERFGAVKGASAHITQNDAAYGQLCGWISGLLEGRHVRQDELIAYVAENLSLAAGNLRAAADNYENTDLRAADAFDRLRGRSPDGLAR